MKKTHIHYWLFFIFNLIISIFHPSFAATSDYGSVVGQPIPLNSISPKFMSASDIAPVSSSAQLFVYKMPSVDGKEINATATLFTPKGIPPKGGWPLVVFAHGTVGIGQNCGPSYEIEKNGVDMWRYDIPIA